MYCAVSARAVSTCGDFLAATALVLALQQRGAGGYAVAAIMIAAAVPPVALVRWTGRLADRVDSRLLLVAAGLGQALVCVALAYAQGVVPIIALVAALACGLAVTQPVLSALLPAMVEEGDLARANALAQTANSVGMLVAPALAGVLVGQIGLRPPLLLDAVSYLAIAAAGLAIRTRRGGSRSARLSPAAPARVPSIPGSSIPDSPVPTPVTGWRLRRDTLLWTVVVLVGAVIAAVSAINVVEVFFVRGVLHASATVFGLLSALWTAAMMGGAAVMSRGKFTDPGLGRAILGLLAVLCVITVGLAGVPAIGWLVPGYVIGGIANGGMNVIAGVLVARRVPAVAHGRAFALFGAVANGANAVGFLLGGVLLGVLPVRAAIAGPGLTGLVVTLVFGVPLLRATARERAATVPPAGAAPGGAVL